LPLCVGVSGLYLSLLNDPFYDQLILRHFEKNACNETDNMYSKQRRFGFFMFFTGALKKHSFDDHRKGSFLCDTQIFQMPCG
jgi:hypothetical protein